VVCIWTFLIGKRKRIDEAFADYPVVFWHGPS